VYLPEPWHFFGPRDEGATAPRADFPWERAAHAVARCAARWATHYWACPTFHREPIREGRLPATAAGRAAFVDELFAWFARENPEGWFCAELSLRRGERAVLDAHDGFPGPLYLTPAQFVVLQRCLVAADLPADLYYPWEEQRRVVEPVKEPGPRGAVYRGVVAYSPRQWAHRDPATVAKLRVPGEAERRARFGRDAHRFQRAILRRMRELREPGRDPRSDEVHAVEALLRPTTYAWMQAGGHGRPELRPLEPSAGWAGRPTALQAMTSSLPALRRLHGDGLVRMLMSQGTRSDGTIRTWILHLWVPSEGRGYRYAIINGVPHEPPSVDVRDLGTPPILRLAGDPPAGVLDSDAARDRALAAGGAAFCAEHGAALGGMVLGFNRDGRLRWSVSFGRFFPHHGLEVALDARSGDVYHTEEHHQPTQSEA
jgi:hypothetical protein